MYSLGFSIAQLGAAVVGGLYLFIGVVGLVMTGFGNFVVDTSNKLVGFDINPFHNVLHALIGIYLLIVSQMNRSVAEGALIGGGLVYLIAAGLGFGDRLQILSINSSGAADNWLHLFSGTGAVVIGLLSMVLHDVEDRREAASTRK